MRSQSPATDAEVVHRSLDTPEEFARLFDRYAGVIHRYLLARAGHPAADDLLSETFLTAFRTRIGYDPAQTDARPWLYAIATRALGNHRRTDARRQDLVARIAGQPTPGAAPSVEEAVTVALTASAAVVRALAEMDPDYRDVVLVVVGTGMTYEEAAGALAVPVGTVRSRLFRARRQIRDALVESGIVADSGPPSSALPKARPLTMHKTGDIHA